MTKVVINKCFGGFTLSKKAIEWLEERGVFNTPDLQDELKRTKAWMKQTLDSYVPDDMGIARDNPLLVECVEVLKKDAFYRGVSKLVVEEVNGTLYKDFFIGDYDGCEEIFDNEEEADDYSLQDFRN